MIAKVFESPRTIRIIDGYEHFIGIKEVRLAQSNVLKAEQEFIASQESRRSLQLDLINIQAQRRRVVTELEKVQRGDDRFIQLITEEHSIIQSEKDLLTRLSLTEKSERSHFSLLSSRLRESHEKERSQTERTKYWSVAGSLIGALIGVLGASANNYIRLREMRRVVEGSVASVRDVERMAVDIHSKQAELCGAIDSSVKLIENSATAKEISKHPDLQKALLQLESNNKSLKSLLNQLNKAPHLVTDPESKQSLTSSRLRTGLEFGSAVIAVSVVLNLLLRGIQGS